MAASTLEKGEQLLSQSAPPEPVRPPVGRSIGRYVATSVLGRGGMGEVFRARDPRLDRDVALKIIPPSFAGDEERRQRFEREARAASALNHPNILTIYEIGEADGVPFIAAELVEGQTVRELLVGGRLGAREAVDVALQTASALAAAHRAGIVHRDIKPDNLMVRSDGYVKVLDFGVALIQPAAGASTSSDGSRDRVGTAQYMSPEQATGQAVDARSDLFSLGVVLYEMLAGRAPFAGETMAQVLSAVAAADPDPLGAEVDQELARIVERALAVDRGARYQGARELQTDLERFLRRLGPDSMTQSSRRPAGETLPRRRVLPRVPRRLLVAVVAAAAVAGVAFGAGRLLRESAAPASSPGPSLAVLPLGNAGGGPELDYLADGISESLINQLSQVPGLSVMSRSSAFRFRGPEVDPKEVGRRLRVDQVVLGRVSLRGDRISVGVELVDTRDGRQRWGRQYRRRLTELLSLQAEIAGDLTARLHPSAGEEEQAVPARRTTDDVEAYQLYLKGRYHWNKYTEAGFEKSIQLFRQAIDRDPAYAMAWAGLADAYSILAADLVRTPVEVMPLARSAALRAVAIDESLAQGHLSLGIVQLFYDWDWPAAARELLRARALEPHGADVAHFYGHYLEVVGRVDEAVVETRRSLELDPLSLIVQAELTWALYYAGRDDEAIEQGRKALEMDPAFVFASWTIASPYERQGRYPEAIAELERAREIDPEWPPLAAELAYAQAASGERAAARRLLAQLEAQADDEYVDATLIALVHLALGDDNRALTWLERAERERSSLVLFSAVESKFTPLRAHPRFQALLRRMRLAR